MDIETSQAIFKGIRSKKQEAFIVLYCNPESPSFDNGCQSYIKAYNQDNTNVAAVEAHTLLNKPHVIKAIERYRAYIHEVQGFQLDWLDAQLKRLFNKVTKLDDDKQTLAILKTIGDRIGAFKDQAEDKAGIFMPLTAEQEIIANQVIKEIMNKKRTEQAKALKDALSINPPQLDIKQPELN